VAPFSESRSLLTIHNLGYQGILPASAAGELGLSAGTDLLVAGDPSAGHINLLGLGLRDADRVSTVSPTYAAEICTPELGMGLDGVLLARGEPVVGIMNGVDYAAWDPATDRHLPHHYSAADLSGKARCVQRCARSWASTPTRAGCSSAWSRASSGRRASTWSPSRSRRHSSAAG
jgi:starch synthase